MLYITQRADAGLIITEGTAISDTAKGVLYISGLHTRTGNGLEKSCKSGARKRKYHIYINTACRPGVSYIKPT